VEGIVMTDDTITERNKQTVITRSASVNSAISIISLINGKPADVTPEEVIELAARIERWIWRGLREEVGSTPTRETLPAELTRPNLPKPPTQARPGPATARGDRLPPRPEASKSNGGGQWGGQASEKQINAIFAIGRSKGYDANGLKAEIKEKLGKSVMQLTSREASKLIDDLKAL
jgi:hypothetical protein